MNTYFKEQYQDLKQATSKLISRTKMFIRTIFLKYAYTVVIIL